MKSRFAGALVGTGIGDALGAPFEGRRMVSPEEIEAVAGRREALTYTDDTHMTIGLAESLLRSRGFDADDLVQTFMANYDLEPYRGYGPGPPRLFRLVRAGTPWRKAALELYRGGSYGNGSAMRAAPIGVFYYDDLETLRDVAWRSSETTHAHRLGREGAALQACAVALATGLEPGAAFDRDAFLSGLSGFAPEGIYREKLDGIRGLPTEPDTAGVAGELGNGIEAFNSVPAAIFSFLAHPDSFAQAVLYAISLGGDTDTIGAMTGAISGAYLGIGAIPDRWKNKLENRHYMEQLGERLWEMKGQDR
ncbi:MAG: ADP-ribosylglycohydrolase family protein [Chloroflexi bacterium]|nr:ADP-ribosylglycohydrolase family protein [Chloroflexota bacterium]